MAYARYGRNCNWYIFWHGTKEDSERERREGPTPKTGEVLAIWHCDHRASGPLFTYADVKEMLAHSDFSRIPGYLEADRSTIADCLSEFMHDVDADRSAI